MFDKKVQAEALILDDEGSGHVVDTDFHGFCVAVSWGFVSPRVWVRVHLLGAGGRRGPMNRLSMTIDALDAPWPFVAVSRSAV